MNVTSGKDLVSGLLVAAFIAISLSIGYTILSNRQIAQRRLVEPVQTVGTLVSSHCTTFVRGSSRGGPQPYAALEYKYLTIDPNPTQHVLATAKWFDTLKDCAAFEKLNSKVLTIWYEKEHPEKASLYKTESFSWGVGLIGLVVGLILAIAGVYDQKAINKKTQI